METTALGTNGPRVSRLGYGSMQMPWKGDEIIPLVGISMPSRIADTMRAFDVALSREEMA